jgi:rare lipoprotein A
VIEAYVTVASVDPADVFFATTAVATADLPAVTAVGYTPASFQVGAQPLGTASPLLPEPPIRRSYAADRVELAYAAVEDVGEGVSLADLTRQLEAVSTRAPVPAGTVIQVGLFANPDNAARIADALRGIGSVSVEGVAVNGKPLSQVRLSALLIPADEAIVAAGKAGAHGAYRVR